MRRSELFVKTRKEVPADETSRGAINLVRAGFVHKEMAGVYDFLPFGLKVLDNIASIVREEMNKVGGQEVRMTVLQDPELWKKSGRWDDKNVDVWFKTELRASGELGMGWTHEEPITHLLTNYVTSYKDLPFMAYQIQTKFRNELRAKSGIMRGREFLMKDMYSFARTEEEHQELYERIKEAYNRVYKRLGIGDKTFLTFASGGAFSKFSHEFQTVTDAGEDTIYLDENKNLAVNQEVMNPEVLAELELNKEDLKEVKAAEVGNIFTLGTKFSEPLGLSFRDEKDESKPVLMGCYGIGVSRTMGVIAELLSDEKGLVWPASIAPYKVYLARLSTDKDVVSAADDVYKQLTEAGITVLYDDRDVRAGEMFADADLLGCPWRVVVSSKTTATNQHELKGRTSSETQLYSVAEIIETLGKALTD